MTYLNALTKSLAGYVIALGVVCFLSGIALSSYYQGSLPREPIAEEGRVYPLDDHGSVVYMNSRERGIHESLIWGGWGVVGGATVVQTLNRKSKRSEHITSIKDTHE